MTADFDTDLLVIGGGSGGVRAARVAAGYGARVMLAEEFRVGGTCVIRGCVPKKLFVYAGRFADAFTEAAEFGWDTPSAPRFDWPKLVAAKDREIGRLEGLYADALEKAGVEIVRARATLRDAKTVEIGTDRRVRARTILIASGSRPEVPSFEGSDLCITSNEVFDLPRFPRRLVVAGAGYIAIEIAGVFAALGSEVTIVCRGDNVLRGFDEDLRQCVAAAYKDRGIALLFGDAITRVEQASTAGTRCVSTANGARLLAEEVLLAYGRAPAVTGLGLERAGVKLNDRGAIVVDGMSRTSVPNIYAVGDVIDRLNLTPAAVREGHAFADTVFGKRPWTADESQVATAVFSTPEVGTVGLTEHEARELHPDVDIYTSRFRTLMAAASGSGQLSLVKLVAEGRTGRVLGVHLFAEGASEMAQMAAIALKAGATVEAFMTALAVHPTIGEELVGPREPTFRYRSP